MLACVSPADWNLEESVNTLRYAQRARAITNSASRNDVVSSNINREMAIAEAVSVA